MKNNNFLYFSIGAGALLAGTVAYFFMTDAGKEKLKNAARDVASTIISDKTGISKRHVRKAAQHVG